MSSERFTGKVIFFNKGTGYGFLEWSKNGVKQKDMFCHFSDITMEGFKLLKKGQTVSFGVGANNSGNPKAIDIVVIKEINES